MIKKTNQKFFKKRIFGFDIETFDNNKKFLMCSIYSDDVQRIYYSPKDLIEDIRTDKIFKNSVIFATNLAFDFFGTFFDTEDISKFDTLFRGSHLISAETRIRSGEFTKFKYDENRNLYPTINFLDSMNYAQLSVSDMGKIVGLGKLESPDFIGSYPKDEREWNIMIEYNLRDSEITYKFMKFLIEGFERLGATFKNTIASTSLSLFKNRYLDHIYYRHDEPILLEQFKAYYGGRTEAFKRGKITDMKYYDFNSLYPSVMRDMMYPDPNTLKITSSADYRYIEKYEGMSKVNIDIPYMKHPPLPHRNDNGRVIFPRGNITGWYTHVEIRYAVSLGASVNNIYKTHFYENTCRPFKGFVEDLYNLRLKYKKDKSPMELVTKLLMNSLYGKFGQKFTDMDNWVPVDNITFQDLRKYDSVEINGNFMRVTENKVRPSHFCFPIWACYVTAYGRIKLHKAIHESDAVYCDTDSIITDKEIETSNRLGDLKLEMNVDQGIIVRPKFYALVDQDIKRCNTCDNKFRDSNICPVCNSYDTVGDYHVKIKGVSKRLTFAEFYSSMQTSVMKYEDDKMVKYVNYGYEKFCKFKEAMRRDLIPNEIVKVNKELSLEDEKRDWDMMFDHHILSDSEPIILD